MSSNASLGDGKKVGILGVPLGFGASQTGSELGVEAMRLARSRGAVLIDHIHSLGFDVADYGNVQIVKPHTTAQSDDNPKYIKEMVESCENIASDVKRIMADGALPIILGGDHSIAIGSVAGVASHLRGEGKELGLIWFDAHADINTPATSLSGNIHGMPLAAILGRGDDRLVNLEGFAPKIKIEHCAHVGGRDLDAGERQAVYELGLRDNFFTMSDIDKRGMLSCVEDAIAIASRA